MKITTNSPKLFVISRSTWLETSIISLSAVIMLAAGINELYVQQIGEAIPHLLIATIATYCVFISETRKAKISLCIATNTVTFWQKTLFGHTQTIHDLKTLSHAVVKHDADGNAARPLFVLSKSATSGKPFLVEHSIKGAISQEIVTATNNWLSAEQYDGQLHPTVDSNHPTA